MLQDIDTDSPTI